MYRDYSKLVNTKQFYTGSNEIIFTDPGLHCQAILDGVKSEHASHLLEDLL